MPVEESSGALKQADRKRFPPAPGKQNQRRNIHEQYKENRTSVARLGHGNAIHAGSRKKPDRTIRLSGKAVAAGVGFGWGKGTLTYKGVGLSDLRERALVRQSWNHRGDRIGRFLSS